MPSDISFRRYMGADRSTKPLPPNLFLHISHDNVPSPKKKTPPPFHTMFIGMHLQYGVCDLLNFVRLGWDGKHVSIV